MLEIGWSEILVIAIVAILVVGPKELPGMLRTFGRAMTRIRAMANEFRGQFEEALREADLDDVRKGLDTASKLNPVNAIREAIDPLRQVGQDIKNDLQRASNFDKPTTNTGPVTPSPDEVSVLPELDALADLAPEPVPQNAAAAQPAVQPTPAAAAAATAQPTPAATATAQSVPASTQTNATPATAAAPAQPQAIAPAAAAVPAATDAKADPGEKAKRSRKPAASSASASEDIGKAAKTSSSRAKAPKEKAAAEPAATTTARGKKSAAKAKTGDA